MQSEILQSYLRAIGKLNRATINGIKAPHKPLLLLSIVQSIGCGEITDNQIRITPRLVARFKDNWNLLVNEEFFTPNFALPFYHLSKEKNSFWHLQTYSGKEILLTSSLSIRSFAQLREAVAYSFLDEPLFALLQHSESRDIIYHFLLQRYFNNAVPFKTQASLFEEIADQILHEPAAIYQQQVENADEEEIFIRSGVFKKIVPQIYNYACCITGMRINSGYDIQMVDACHIVPFAISHNDTITNGISLCPNLHRAFDRGLVTIDSDYRVLVSNSFTESADTGIRKYQGKLVLLPSDSAYYPSIQNLYWHRETIFKK